MISDKMIILLPILFFHLVGAQQLQLGNPADRWFFSIPAPRSSVTCPCLFGAGRPTNIPDDYTFVAGIGSYKLHTEAKLWNEARITCEEEGGHLAIINSVAEANAVTEIFKNAEPIVGSPHPNYASIGFHDLFHEGQFITIHEQTLAKAGFTQWKNGEPNNANGNENCGSLRKSGGLNDISCATPYTPGIGAHKVHIELATWNEARRICKDEGGHLAIINSVAEANILGTLLNQAEPHKLWAFIGFHDLFQQGDYITVHDQSLAEAGFTQWFPGEPNNGPGGGERCGCVYKPGKLCDFTCNTKWPFVCEIPLK